MTEDKSLIKNPDWMDDYEGQLAVDVYQTEEQVVVNVDALRRNLAVYGPFAASQWRIPDAGVIGYCAWNFTPAARAPRAIASFPVIIIRPGTAP